jgi:hypothetical protein
MQSAVTLRLRVNPTCAKANTVPRTVIAASAQGDAHKVLLQKPIRGESSLELCQFLSECKGVLRRLPGLARFVLRRAGSILNCLLYGLILKMVRRQDGVVSVIENRIVICHRC